MDEISENNQFAVDYYWNLELLYWSNIIIKNSNGAINTNYMYHVIVWEFYLGNVVNI